MNLLKIINFSYLVSFCSRLLQFGSGSELHWNPWQGANTIQIRIRIVSTPSQCRPPKQKPRCARALPHRLSIYIYIYIYICIVFVRRTALSFLCGLGHPPPCAAQSPGAPSPNPKCGAPPFPFLVQPRAPATLLAQLGAWHVPMFRPKARTCKAAKYVEVLR